jgi:hypothetical protein
MSTKPFADGLPPDIASDVFYLVCGPKNVVVVAHFPERTAVGFVK